MPLAKHLLAAVVILSGGPPAAAWALETQTYAREASGPVDLLSGWACWFDDCRQANCHMATEQRPRHGSLTPVFRPKTIESGKCAGHPLSGLTVTYAPRPGFTGPDRVVFHSKSDNGLEHVLIYDISVLPH